MSRALYRKYRSTSLSEVVGQKHVTDILEKSLAAGHIAHAYLLTGPRGVGKTSIARILAYEINKLPYDEAATNLDIIEIDAASNNGVEDVRALRERVQVAPVAADKKVYIIDEVHMLSKAAFNALLKTLEEPPEHAVFILATTDVDKLPATIISRTQRFSFRAISQQDAAAHLRTIATKEKINIDDDALELIALRGDGSFRDSISILDQLKNSAGKGITISRELVETSLGLAPASLVVNLLDAYQAKDLKKIISLIDDSDQQGIQASIVTTQLIQHIRSAIAETPQLLPLLDQLLEVSKSSQPNIKLLTVLAAQAVPKPKTAALQVATPVISAPIAELAQQAVQEKPAMPPVTPVAPPPAKPTAATSHKQPPVAAVSAPAAPVPTKSATVTNDGVATTLNWDELIEYTRQHYVAIYSVLKKCTHSQDGDVITLYTGTAFWKKKLDDTRHRLNLVDAMEKTGALNLSINTVGTAPPPKDGVAASVAAIMGGGEEVTVG